MGSKGERGQGKELVSYNMLSTPCFFLLALVAVHARPRHFLLAWGRQRGAWKLQLVDYRVGPFILSQIHHYSAILMVLFI